MTAKSGLLSVWEFVGYTERRWSPAGQIDWPKFVFLKTLSYSFLDNDVTAVDEVNNNKTKVQDKFILLVSRLFVLASTELDV